MLTLQSQKRNGVPSNALLLTLIGPIGLSLLNLGSPIALNAVISLVIVNLITSYLLVAGCSLYARYSQHGLYEVQARHITNHLLHRRQGLGIDVFSIVVLIAGFIIALLVFLPLHQQGLY